MRARVQRLDDRRLVRRLRRRAHPAVPHPAVGRRARGRRSRAQRGARRRAICFSEIPTHLGLPSIHTGYWDPLFAVCEETRTTLCMHIGSSSKMPAASPDAPPSTDIMLSFNNSMASLADFLFSGVLVRFPKLKLAYSEGQIGWIPVRARTGRQRVGVPLELDEGEGDGARAAVDLLPGPHLRLLHERRARHARRSTRSARTTSASRPTTRTPTRRGPSRAKRSNA